MNSNVTNYWWEEGDFHTVEDGQHFVYTDATILDQTISAAADDGHVLVRSEKIQFARREPIDVLEVPFD
jgi:hypothetical protein